MQQNNCIRQNNLQCRRAATNIVAATAVAVADGQQHRQQQQPSKRRIKQSKSTNAAAAAVASLAVAIRNIVYKIITRVIPIRINLGKNATSATAIVVVTVSCFLLFLFTTMIQSLFVNSDQGGNNNNNFNNLRTINNRGHSNSHHHHPAAAAANVGFGNSTFSAEVTIFYHIYFPLNKGQKGLEETVNILQEQVRSIRQAAQNAMSGASVNIKAWKVVYTTTGAISNSSSSSSIKILSMMSSSSSNNENNRAGADGGDKHPIHAWFEQTVCQQHAPYLKCQASNPGVHYDVGYEDITLSALYKHCHGGANDLVVYLHSKGTYHTAQGRNHVWRRALTQAAMHLDCLESLVSDQCNVCGLQFYPLWTTFFPGNMFSSNCRYVEKLLEPETEFPKQLAAVVAKVAAENKNIDQDHATNSNSNNNLSWTHSLYNFDNPGNVGLERYASEHWIGSHPTLRPCDIQGNETRLFSERVIVPTKKISERTTTKTTTFINWWLSFWGMTDKKRKPPPDNKVAYIPNDTDVVVVRPAPRVSVEDGHWFRLNQKALQKLLLLYQNNSNTSLLSSQSSSLSMEYFLLPGLLYRHYQLYHTYPLRDSWMWKWYPQGQEWWNKVYGNYSSSNVDGNIGSSNHQIDLFKGLGVSTSR